MLLEASVSISSHDFIMIVNSRESGSDTVGEIRRTEAALCKDILL